MHGAMRVSRNEKVYACVCCVCIDVGVMSSSEIRNPHPDFAVFAVYCRRRSVEREVDEGESAERGREGWVRSSGVVNHRMPS